MDQPSPTKVDEERRRSRDGAAATRHTDADRPLRKSLRGKILVRALLIALVPLVLIGSITLGSLLRLSRTADSVLASEREELGNEVAGRRLRTEAVAVAQELDGFLHERISDVTGWASDPTVTDAAARAARNSQDLAALGNDELEERFADSPLLGSGRGTRAFLRERQRRERGFSSLFFTERNGFNVTATSTPDDFVQRDEPWWQAAQIRGLYFGEVEYDAAEDLYSLPISARVQNPSNGEGFGGVLQSRLGVDLIQRVASRTAGREGRQITVLLRNRQVLAETASDHSSERVMRQGMAFEGDRGDAVDEAMAATGPGFMVADDTAFGYASLADVRNRRGGTSQDINDFLGIDANPIDWVVVVEQPAELAFAQLDGLSTVRSNLNETATRLAAIGVIALLLAILGATLVSGRLSRRIVAPLQSLRRSAYVVADRQLPELVAHVQSADPDAKPPAVPTVEVDTDDEVEDVAEAFNVVRDTAVDLAAEQARSRRNVATMFVNLGRRNQGLLSRQLEFIDTLERGESDPELLDSLFRLDHLATRMRRNAESLLVLAGEDPPRRWSEPVPLEDVVRGAVAEVEDYQRVEVDGVSDILVDGQAASDIAHLLAELIENATNFSPPDQPVTVVGRWVADGYALAVVDEGIGMAADALAAANERLDRSPSLDRVPSSYLGLFVVGRLADRHGIDVRLLESMAEGIIAKVVLPSALVESSSAPSSPQALELEAGMPLSDEVNVPRRTTSGDRGAAAFATSARDGHAGRTATDDRAGSDDGQVAPVRAAPPTTGHGTGTVHEPAAAQARADGAPAMFDDRDHGVPPEPAVFPRRGSDASSPPATRGPQGGGDGAGGPDGGGDGARAPLRRRVSKRASDASDTGAPEVTGTEDDTAQVAPLRLDGRQQPKGPQDEGTDDAAPPPKGDDPHHAHRAAHRTGDRLGRFQRAVRKGRSDASSSRNRPDSES